jgi:hypothetical protein
MGNYNDIEKEFIERTLALIGQYEHLMHKYEFEEQYNYTLLLNCLLGLIVMPKEKTITFIPKERITTDLKSMLGIPNSKINPEITDIKELIIALRNSIAHFNISVDSKDQNFLIDEIVFKDKEIREDYEVARFQAKELLPFIRYYASWILKNYDFRKVNQ